MNFEHLKVGDRVDRYHGSGFFMEMEVVEIRGNLLVCAAVHKDKDGKDDGLFKGRWTFDRNSGVEEDDDLHWGIKYGATGTYLKLKEKS
jgi:hypothetical protein